MKRLSILLLLVCTINLFGAASPLWRVARRARRSHQAEAIRRVVGSAASSSSAVAAISRVLNPVDPQALKWAREASRTLKESPYFFAVLADASYNPSKNAAQKTVNKLMGRGHATVLDLKRYESKVYGTTRLILVKDRLGKLHVAIDGSASLRNWIGNAAMPIRGAFAEYDVPPRMRDGIHEIIKDWEKDFHGRVATVVGHSQGGMYASQVLAACKKHYKRHTTAITFNGFKPKKKQTQIHLKTDNEHASCLCSPSGRYIDIKRSGPHWQLVRNHKLKFFLEGLKGKSWDYILSS